MKILLKTYNKFEVRLDWLRDTNLTPTEKIVNVFLNINPNLTIKELVELTNINMYSVRNILTKLRQKGYAKKRKKCVNQHK